MPEEGGGGGREVRGELPEGAECLEPEPEGEVRGGPQEGDQEAAAAERPDQDVDRVGRHQRQDGPHGEEEVHRVGESKLWMHARVGSRVNCPANLESSN